MNEQLDMLCSGCIGGKKESWLWYKRILITFLWLYTGAFPLTVYLITTDDNHEQRMAQAVNYCSDVIAILDDERVRHAEIVNYYILEHERLQGMYNVTGRDKRHLRTEQMSF